MSASYSIIEPLVCFRGFEGSEQVLTFGKLIILWQEHYEMILDGHLTFSKYDCGDCAIVSWARGSADGDERGLKQSAIEPAAFCNSFDRCPARKWLGVEIGHRRAFVSVPMRDNRPDVNVEIVAYLAIFGVFDRFPPQCFVGVRSLRL